MQNTLQNTKNEYAKGNKGMAYIMYSQDPTAKKDTSFEDFCIGMDKITQPLIQLQSIGWCPAKQAGELKANDTMVWNFGYTSTVVEVVKETAKSIWIKSKSDESGDVYERRFAKTRLVACK